MKNNNRRNERSDSGYYNNSDSLKQPDGISDQDDSYRLQKPLLSDNDSAMGGES